MIFSIERILAKNFVESSSLDFFPKLSKVIVKKLSVRLQRFASAGEEQRHYIHNTFNCLVNEGFLRDQQGVQTRVSTARILAKKVNFEVPEPFFC